MDEIMQEQKADFIKKAYKSNRAYIQFRIDKDIKRKLDAAAKAVNIPLSTLVERALITYMDRMDKMIEEAKQNKE